MGNLRIVLLDIEDKDKVSKETNVKGGRGGALMGWGGEDELIMKNEKKWSLSLTQIPSPVWQ